MAQIRCCIGLGRGLLLKYHPAPVVCVRSMASHEVERSHLSRLFTSPRTTLSRLVMPADTQMLGIAHGGVMLTLMEEAGELHTTRYCSLCGSTDDAGQKKSPIAALAYVEKTNFIRPLKLGDFMQVETQIVYTSVRSIRVLVSMYGTNMETGRQLAAKSIMWYVPVDRNNVTSKLRVPTLESLDPALQQEGQQAYEKLQVMKRETCNQSLLMTCTELIGHSDFVVQPVHCGQHSICKGGPVMRWIDESAGVAAVHHCRMSCVTASVDNMRFYSSVPIGGFLTILSRPVFTSSRTVDIYTVAYQQRFDIASDASVVYEKVADAFLTFTAFKRNKEVPATFPPVVPVTEEDKRLYALRQKVYDERKSRTS